MVAENGSRNRLKIRKLPFWTKFEALNREINNLQKNKFTGDTNDYDIQYLKISFRNSCTGT